jgi:hypothetical protein
MRTYLASLAYLREEAKRDGLDVVATILLDALAALERWLDSGSAPVTSQDMLDASLCHALSFLLKWLALPRAKQRKVAEVIARYEVESVAIKTTTLRRRVSKRTSG